MDKLLLPIIVSALHLLLPATFRIIASMEKYQHPRTTINVNLARYFVQSWTNIINLYVILTYFQSEPLCYLFTYRTVLLKLTSLGVILIALFTDVTRCRKGQKVAEQICLPVSHFFKYLGTVWRFLDIIHT